MHSLFKLHCLLNDPFDYTHVFCHSVFIVIETDHKKSHDYKEQQLDTIKQYKSNINQIQSTLRDL